MGKPVMNFLERKRDKKLTDLYRILTNSDLKGNIQSSKLVLNLYTLYCLDSTNRNKIPFTEDEYLTLSRELMRIEETDLYDWDFSLTTWAYGLLCFMEDGNLSVSDIKKMNSVDLKKSVYTYIDRGE